MTKLHDGIIKNSLLILLLCLAEMVFSGQSDSCKTFLNNNEFINPISYNFKVGDLVVFKKFEQGFLLEGKITEINQTMALVEYIDPDEPTKIKDFSIELDKLTKVEIVNSRTSLDLNLKIIFKKINSERLYEGVIIGINQTNVVIEYKEPLEPKKTKEIVVEFSKLYRIVTTDNKDEIIENKVVQKPENNAILKIGDYVKFKKLSSENEFEGIITVLKENIVEIEYYDPATPSIKRSIEKKANELTKIEKLTQWDIDNNINTKKAIVINPDFKAGDKVFFKSLMPALSGIIIETYQNTALIEFIDIKKGFRKNQMEVEYSNLKKL